MGFTKKYNFIVYMLSSGDFFFFIFLTHHKMNPEEKEFEISQLQQENLLEVAIKLASTNKQKLENVCRSFYNFAATKIQDMTESERLETKTATITTRKSPCGEGTNTWARYKLHVYGRRFQFAVSHDILAKMADFLKNSDVEIILSIKN